MKTIYALLATSLAVIAASPAFAQDTGQDAPATPAQAFSGAHVEATFGWDHLNVKSLKDIDPTAQTEAGKDGVTYGGAIGYDVPFGTNWTVGGELGVYGSSIRWNNDVNLNPGTFNTAQVNEGRDLYVGGRLGYALSNKTQVYGKAGYTNTRFGVTGTDGNYAFYQGINASGFRLGAGVEQKLTRATYVKLEYDFSHYGSGQFNYAGSTPDGSSFDMHDDQHQLLASVGLRF